MPADLIHPTDRILVTGAHGFLGGHVTARLRAEGFANLLTPGRSECDLTRQSEVEQYFARHRPQAVIHLAAAVGGIGAHKANPGKFFYDNLAMGLHLVEAARQAETKQFVQVGTICSYPNITPLPFDEGHLWEGYPDAVTAPYGLAKKGVLTLLQTYAAQYAMKSCFLMPVNLYGPGDDFDPASAHVAAALVRRVVEAAEQGAERIVNWGTGTATREFLYAADCAEAIVLAARRVGEPEPINLGSGEETSIRALTELIAGLAGFTGRVEWDASKPDGQPRRCVSTARAAERLGWRASTPLGVGLAETIAWFRRTRGRAGV